MQKNKNITFKDSVNEAKKYFLKSGLSILGVTLLFFTLDSVLASIGIYKALAGFLSLCPYVLTNFYIIKKYTKDYKQKLEDISNQMVESCRQDAENMKEELQKKYEHVITKEKVKKESIINDIKYVDDVALKTNKVLLTQKQYLDSEINERYVDKNTINTKKKIKVKR